MHCVYDRLPEAIAGLGYRQVDAILFDLGVSSMQLDLRRPRLRVLAGRRPGHADGPDRGDHRGRGPQHLPGRGARADPARATATSASPARSPGRSSASGEREPFTTSARLVELIRDTIPAPARRTGGNPAKRTFQALRIEVNAELDVLRRAIPAALSVLAAGGRMVVLSYHSGEDRIVKAALMPATNPHVPHGLPVIPEELRPTARVLTRGSQKASEDEVLRNPRAASVRLRAVEKVDVREVS